MMKHALLEEISSARLVKLITLFGKHLIYKPYTFFGIRSLRKLLETKAHRISGSLARAKNKLTFRKNTYFVLHNKLNVAYRRYQFAIRFSHVPDLLRWQSPKESALQAIGGA